MENSKAFKIAFARFGDEEFHKVVNEHSLTLPDLSFSDLVGLDYVVMHSGHIPQWVAKIDEVAVPNSTGVLELRTSEVTSVVSKWATQEVTDAFAAAPFNFNGSRTIVVQLDSDDMFTIGDSVQLRAKTALRGALSLEKAVEEIAETYRVEPSQVRISISSKD